MDIKELKAIASLFESMGLSELEVSEGDKKVVMKKNITRAVVEQPAEVFTVTKKQPEVSVPQDNGTQIKAPFAGVFHAAPSPKSQPFVNVGSTVNKGDVLCIIEAMKLMNEIKAEVNGTVSEILVKNEGIVEYGQVLFKLK